MKRAAKGSAVIGLGANIVQPSGIDAVRLPVHRLNQFFRFKLFEHGESAVAEQKPLATVAFNGGDAARAITDVRDTATFGENV